MLVVIKRRYKKQHVIGGAGFFDSVAGVVKRFFTSNAAKRIASTALSAGKDAAKEIGKTAPDVGKTAAIDAGKRLVDKVVAKLQAPKNRVNMPTLPTLTPENAAVLARLIGDEAPAATTSNTNINKLLAGSGMKSGSNAIAIQDLVRRLNGAGLKMA